MTSYPLKALRELAFNSIVHKDYSKMTPIEIQIFSDHLYISNPNSPLPPIRVVDLMNETHFPNREYLNPDIMRMFHDLKLVETYGSGIRIAKEELKKNGSPEFKYDLRGDDNNTTTVFVYINEEYKKLRESYENGEKTTRQDEKTTRQHLSLEEYANFIKSLGYRKEVRDNVIRLYSYYAEKRIISKSILIEKMNFSEQEARSVLENLRHSNIVREVKRGQYKFVDELITKE
mgnify:CR=1 FL=1